MMVNIQKFSLRVVKENGGRYDIDKTINNPIAARNLFIEVAELDKRSEEVFVMATIDVRK